jgi:hypothetical protein
VLGNYFINFALLMSVLLTEKLSNIHIFIIFYLFYNDNVESRFTGSKFDVYPVELLVYPIELLVFEDDDVSLDFFIPRIRVFY